MAINEISGALALTKGPSLMDLQEALLFNWDKELYFYPRDYQQPVTIKLSGMLHKPGKLTHSVETEHWLLLGYVVDAQVPGRQLTGRQVSINYAPKEHAGFMREDPQLKIRDDDLIW